MLVKYRMLSTITNAQFKADIIGIIEGTITSTGQLSAGADAANSSFVGTYPTGTYTKVGAGTNTFSKVHGTDNTYTHYFRLTFDAGVGLAATLTTFTLAQGYTSGTDTLLNSVAQTVNVSPNAYLASLQFPTGIDIVLTPNSVWIASISSGKSFGIFDMGGNGVTSAYANNMKMVYVNTITGAYSIPYVYKINGALSGYAPLTGNVILLSTPTTATSAAGAVLIIENPIFITDVSQAYITYALYGLFKIANSIFLVGSVYNTAGTRRITAAADYAIVTE